MKTIVIGLLGLLCLAAAPTTQPQEGSSVPGVLNFTMKSLAGDEIPLSKYQGKVILMVNVASKCGNTPQYAGLERIYKKYADKGFVILGFPANDFRHQEPGTDEEISTFCTTKYGVTFDMFSKVVVKGDGQCPLYTYLTSAETDPQYPGPITWNFEKFVIGRDGKIAARFTPKTQPESDKVIAAIETELGK
jgi:glutathione peroxidase